MKAIPHLLILAWAAASASDLQPTGVIEPALFFRAGFDTNPAASGGTSATILGERDTLTSAAGISLSYSWTATTAAKPALKLSYTGEAVRFDRWSGEDYSTHSLGLRGELTAGGWKFTGDASSLFVAGSADTLPSVATVNANAIALWRERRQQWQHRAKVQAQGLYGNWLVRGTGTLLDYDYQTNVAAGRFAFADRSDLQGALDLGWKQSADSLWFTGVRSGHQVQAIVPLPNCGFDYTNNYYRLAAGWEGKPFADTTVTFAAGPDFRHYTGTVDPRVFLGGRDRTSLWFEAGFASKLTQNLTLTGKAARMDWLSSLGKSAYLDTCVETAMSLMLTPTWSARLTAKVHRCDFFPSYRDDWESFLGAGATWKLSNNTALILDLLRHHGWNTLSTLPEREFQRLVVNLGATFKL